MINSVISLVPFHMSEEDGLVSSCSICAAMSDLVGKLTFSSKLLRFVSCFGEVSLFEPLLAFLFFLLVGLTILSYFHLEKNLPRRGAQQSTSIHSDRSTRSNIYNFSRCYCKIVLCWYVDSLECRYVIVLRS